MDFKELFSKAPLHFLLYYSSRPAYYSGYSFFICPSSRSSRETETGNLVFPTSREADFTVFGHIIIQLRTANPNLDEWRLGWGHTSRKQVLYEGFFPTPFWL